MQRRGHLVWVVNRVVDALDLESLLQRYKGGGRSSYHPRMMLKVLIYAYTPRVYSSRQIAKALRENLRLMRLSGGNRPDFRTLNRFRSSTMQEVIEDVFTAALPYLLVERYVKLETYFIDGTKIEANANRHQWVWAKNVRRYQTRLQDKIKGSLDEIERVNAEEQAEYRAEDLEELGGPGEGGLDSADLAARLAELNKKLKEEAQNKPLARAVRALEQDCQPRLACYEVQEETLAGRNSYAESDKDATFMRLKEGHLRRGQLKAAYSVQMGTEHQLVVGSSVHQQAADGVCLIPHLEQLAAQLGELPARVVADAGYGSEENYAYLQRTGVDNFVKYPIFNKEQKRS